MGALRRHGVHLAGASSTTSRGARISITIGPSMHQKVSVTSLCQCQGTSCASASVRICMRSPGASAMSSRFSSG